MLSKTLPFIEKPFGRNAVILWGDLRHNGCGNSIEHSHGALTLLLISARDIDHSPRDKLKWWRGNALLGDEDYFSQAATGWVPARSITISTIRLVIKSVIGCILVFLYVMWSSQCTKQKKVLPALVWSWIQAWLLYFWQFRVIWVVSVRRLSIFSAPSLRGPIQNYKEGVAVSIT